MMNLPGWTDIEFGDEGFGLTWVQATFAETGHRHGVVTTNLKERQVEDIFAAKGEYERRHRARAR